MSDNGGDFGAFLAGFVIGGLVGAATALIMAPQSGQETRTQIVQKGGEWRTMSEGRVHQSVAGTQERLHEMSDQVQEQARIVLDTGKGQIEQTQGHEHAPESETVVSTTETVTTTTLETEDDAEGDEAKTD